MANSFTMLTAVIIVAVIGSKARPTQTVPTTVSLDWLTEGVTGLGNTDGLYTNDGMVQEMTTLPEDETVTMATEDPTTTGVPNDEEEDDDDDDDDEEEGVWKAMRIKFTLLDKSPSDIGEPLRKEIETAMNAIFKARFADYNTSDVTGFSSDSLVAVVELDFEKRVTDERRREAMKIVFEIVERNRTLGSLNVEELYVANTEGAFVRIDNACSITRCPSKMACFSDGNDCRSTCASNAGYCLNDATCVEAAQGYSLITCRCDGEHAGQRCGTKEGDDYDGNADLYVGIIAASAIAMIIVCAIIVATCINIFNKRRIRTGRSEELFGIENVVALELNDEKIQIDGIATQTDESFLLARSHRDGIPPKDGHAHKIMQTNDSFLLAKTQLLRAHGSASRHRGAGSPVGVVSGNARRLSGPSSSRAERDATPTTSTGSGGANGVARKASAKKERAPPPPPGPATACTPDEEAPPETRKNDSTSNAESASKTHGEQTPQDSNKLESPVEPVAEDARILEAKEGKSSPVVTAQGVSPLYPGRKILKV